MSSVAGGIDGLEVRFGDASLVADAGLLLAGTVMDRLGLEALVDETVRPPRAGRGSGAKALSVVASMLVGGSFIDDAERLRAGSASAVLGFEPLAPSTLGRGCGRSPLAMSASSTAPRSWRWAGRGLSARQLRPRR